MATTAPKTVKGQLRAAMPIAIGVALGTAVLLPLALMAKEFVMGFFRKRA